MFKNNNLLVIAFIAIVNALGYGIIIPVLYSYSQKCGLSDFQNGLLFSLFSICRFLSTPVFGGIIATFSLFLLFLVGAQVLVICIFLSLKILRKPDPVQHAF